MRLYVNGALACLAGGGLPAKHRQRPLRIASGNTDGAANFFLPGAWTRSRCTPGRSLGGAGVGALQRPRARVAAATSRRPRSPRASPTSGHGAPRRQLLEHRLERPGRDDRLLRLGSRRRRRLRRLDRPEPLLHLYDGGDVHRGLAGDRQPAAPRTSPIPSRSAPCRQAAAAELLRHRPRRLPALPTGAWARPRGRRPPMPSGTDARART